MDGQAVKKNGMYVVLRQLVDGLWIGVQPSPALEIAQKRPTFWHEDWTFGGSSRLYAGDHRIFRWMAWRRRLAWRRFSRRILRRSPVLECWLLSLEWRLALVRRWLEPVVGVSGSSPLPLSLLRGVLRPRLWVWPRVTVTDEDTDFRSEEVSQVALKSHQSLPLLPPIHN
jgi:hypothetical protein